ncbi:DNA-binding MarR family transcriptional regulator [Nocardioides cavernae]|uniref:DNA-binding MarR family transcriptional regulator n=1 Tax=Nocardioides cavernae TaxID=1921566 RepID=A0A7Y9H1P4_9ACTN|nr:MarR family winged helix-turn-helix transcriptional regulator [Nocardioides cavernae]NYE36334.1 DNA-binding MarR family transcriptional regulator [Nocardioides cavernae]
MNSGNPAPDGLPEDSAVHEGAAGARVDDLDQRLAAAVERMGHVTRTMLLRQAYAEGVSPLQHQLLLRVRALDGRARGSDLATELDVSQATASEALSALRRKELVEKVQDPADRRNVVYSLTASGEELSERLTQWDGPLTARLGEVPEADKATTLRVLLGLVADLHGEGVVSVARTCLTCVFFADGSAGTGLPYRCDLLQVDFDDAHLRVDCAEHQPRSAAS